MPARPALRALLGRSTIPACGEEVVRSEPREHSVGLGERRLEPAPSAPADTKGESTMKTLLRLIGALVILVALGVFAFFFYLADRDEVDHERDGHHAPAVEQGWAARSSVAFVRSGPSVTRFSGEAPAFGVDRAPVDERRGPTGSEAPPRLRVRGRRPERARSARESSGSRHRSARPEPAAPE